MLVDSVVAATPIDDCASRMRRQELPLELEGADNPDAEEHPGGGLDEMVSELDDDLEAALERGESDWEPVEGSDADTVEPDDDDFDAAGARSDADASGRCCPLYAPASKEVGSVDVRTQGMQVTGSLRPSAR